MGTEKRERQKANRAARVAEERKAAEMEKRKGLLVKAVGILVVVFGTLFLYSVLADNDDGDETIATTEESSQETDDADTSTTLATDDVSADSSEESVAQSSGATECPATDGSSEQTLTFAEQMPMCIDETATYVAEMVTNKGTITIELDASKAPMTVNNFVSLARFHFYDDVDFHRIIPGFMVQGGDAVGEPAGTGNPGYSFDDELPEEGEYQIGSVAMANSGADTNGSQFFIVTGESGVALPPSYSLFGQVTNGMDTVTAIEATGSAGAGTPSEPNTILSIEITEK